MGRSKRYYKERAVHYRKRKKHWKKKCKTRDGPPPPQTPPHTPRRTSKDHMTDLLDHLMRQPSPVQELQRIQAKIKESGYDNARKALFFVFEKDHPDHALFCKHFIGRLVKEPPLPHTGPPPPPPCS
jgi:hypothetical protein